MFVARVVSKGTRPLGIYTARVFIECEKDSRIGIYIYTTTAAAAEKERRATQTKMTVLKDGRRMKEQREKHDKRVDAAKRKVNIAAEPAVARARKHAEREMKVRDMHN